MTRDSWIHRFLVWSFVCGMSAGPSFVWALSADYTSDEQILAMLLGILMFILAYTWVTGTEPVRALRRRRRPRAALTTGYVTRIAITIAFPVGMYVDLWFGMIAVSFVDALPFRDPEGFAGTLLTTLVEGAIMNVALCMYMLVVLSILMIFMEPDPPSGYCVKCGYDLRGVAHDSCPECGTPCVDRQAGSLARTHPTSAIPPPPC